MYFRRQNVKSLKEVTRLAMRNLGSNVWREMKAADDDLGLPLTLKYFLDYDDFDF